MGIVFTPNEVRTTGSERLREPEMWVIGWSVTPEELEQLTDRIAESAAHIDAATHGLLGNEKEARAEAAEVLRLTPDFVDGILRTPFRDHAVRTRVLEGLRKAGLDVPERPAKE